MNTQQLLQHCLLAASLAGAAVCLAAVLAHHFRNQLRTLHERWLGLGPLGRVATLGLATVFVVYGSTKSPTNDPPDTVGGDTTNPPPMMCSSPRPRLSAPPQQPTTDNQQLTTLTAWHKRGAFSDWHRIDFPSSFSFPYGTNLLTSITLFAYGEIRESLRQPTTIDQQLTTLPTAVSLEPGVSSCTYGLTPSNSFLIAWQNACVDRSATNRVDASIELFRNGDICVITQPLTTNNHQPPTTNYYPAPLPEGFVGENQDNAWALANFPDDYDAITNKGYEAWLMEDKVGINVENGLYKAAITVGEIPTNEPCYLVCGPYKVVLKAPGTYSFPLEVFEHYEARTYPTAVPLSVEYDDGYRGEVASDMLMSTPTHAPRLMGFRPLILPIYLPASFYASPNQIELSQAAGAVIQLWCNFSSACQSVWQSESSTTLIGWLPPSRAEIKRVLDADLIVFRKITGKGESQCTVSIVPNSHCCCGSCTGAGCTCGCDCPNHHSGTNAPPTTGSEP